MNKNMSKRNKFLKSIAVIGAATIMTGTGLSIANANADLSRYDTDTDRYVDYIDGSENKKLKKMMELDEKIGRYEELSKIFFQNEEEKAELEEITNYLKNEMSSGYLAEFYLSDLLKEKLKEAYNRDKDKQDRIENIETHWDIDGIGIKMKNKYGVATIMEEKDKVGPIRGAMGDIAELQAYQGKKEFSKTQINNFIKIQRDMKGFSNLKFVKEEGKALRFEQIDLKEQEQEQE